MEDQTLRVTLVVAESLLDQSGRVVGDGAVPSSACWVHPTVAGRFGVSSYDLPEATVASLRRHPLVQMPESTPTKPPLDALLIVIDPEPLAVLATLELSCPAPL